MAITKNAGRQEVVSTSPLALTYATLADDTGVSEAVVEVPAGAVVVGGYLNVTEVFNSTTSDVVDIGDGVDPDRYTASAVDLTALGVTALDVTGATGAGYEYPAQDNIDVQWTAGSTGTATTGIAYLVVQYIVDGRAAFSQG